MQPMQLSNSKHQKYNRATTLCETSGRQVSLLGAKSRHVGDKCEIMRPERSEHPELAGRQVGDKCEIMRPEHSEHPELTGRQVGNKWETNGRQV